MRYIIYWRKPGIFNRFASIIEADTRIQAITKICKLVGWNNFISCEEYRNPNQLTDKNMCEISRMKNGR